MGSQPAALCPRCSHTNQSSIPSRTIIDVLLGRSGHRCAFFDEDDVVSGFVGNSLCACRSRFHALPVSAVPDYHRGQAPGA